MLVALEVALDLDHASTTGDDELVPAGLDLGEGGAAGKGAHFVTGRDERAAFGELDGNRHLQRPHWLPIYSVL